MPKIRVEDLSKWEQEDIDDMSRYSFEKYCGSCIFFNTDNCPYNGVVFELTEWQDINCKKFFD